MRVIQTVANGDCGLDVACMMLRQPRGELQRNALRTELCDFAFKHCSNRSLVASLHGLAEIPCNLGFFSLEESAAVLLQRVDHGSVETGLVAEAEHHGDGEAVGPAAPVDQTNHTGVVNVSEAILANQKKFSEEEIQAITMKCQLQKASPECVYGLLVKFSPPPQRKLGTVSDV